MVLLFPFDESIFQNNVKNLLKTPCFTEGHKVMHLRSHKFIIFCTNQFLVVLQYPLQAGLLARVSSSCFAFPDLRLHLSGDICPVTCKQHSLSVSVAQTRLFPYSDEIAQDLHLLPFSPDQVHARRIFHPVRAHSYPTPVMLAIFNYVKIIALFFLKCNPVKSQTPIYFFL